MQTWLDQTAKGLRERGWEVALGLTGAPRFHDPAAYAVAHPGHRVVPVVCRTGTHEGRTRAILRVLEEERPAALVLVNVAEGLEAARRWKLRSRDERFRVVYTIHAFLAGQIADLLSHEDTVDRVVATNRLMEKALRRFLRASNLVGYAPYGAEAPVLPAARPRRDSRSIRFAWVGRIEEPQKRAEDLSRVLDRLTTMNTEFECDVVGDGPSAPRLRETLQGLVASGKVRFRGYMTRDELYESVYPAIDALLVTSSWETGPIVAWEAMRNGACLVSTRYVGLAEEGALVDGENCLLAGIGDVEGLARGLGRLGSEGGLRERLARAGRETAEARYSLETSANAWSEEIAAALRYPGRMPGKRDLTGVRGSRLDRWFGPGAAETLRELTGREGRAPSDPGDEWPHELHEKLVSVSVVAEELQKILAGDGEDATVGAPMRGVNVP